MRCLLTCPAIFFLTFTFPTLTSSSVVIPPELVKVTRCCNRVGLEVLRKLPKNVNVLFSPFTLCSNLLQIYAGSSTRTMRNIEEVMNFGFFNLTYAEALKSFGAIIRGIVVRTDRQQVVFKNDLLLDSSFNPFRTYLANAEKLFKSKVKQLGLSDPATLDAVKNLTEHTSRGLLDTDFVNSQLADASAVFLSTLFFRATWKLPFPLENTRQVPFRVAPNKQVQIQMMNVTGKFLLKRIENLKLTVLKLPYSGDRLSMVVLLPEKLADFQKIETLVSGGDINKMLSWLEEKTINVFLPRFKFQYTISLTNALKDIGLGKVFEENTTLPLLTSSKDVRLREIFQTSSIDVLEDGTKAASVNLANVGAGSKLTASPDAVTASHPFIFFLKDKISNIILFWGRVVTL